MRGLAFALAALVVATAPAARAAIRIAVPAPATAPCAKPAAQAPPAQVAYFKHLAGRMKTEILACPTADRAAAAGLAAGTIDLAVLDQASWPAAAAKARAILTPRAQGALSRVPVVLATRAAGPAGTAALRGAPLVFGGTAPAALALPKRALADHLGAGFFGPETSAADPEGALAALRAGRARAAALHAGAWQRLCRGDSPSQQPCADLKTVWRGRPRAALAVVVRRDLPDETRFRLIGIQVALHLEAPAAFGWVKSWAPAAVELEAAEGEALAQRPAGER